MSKLVFPDHGGVLVPDDTKVVRTIKRVVGGRLYTIKIVRYHPDQATMYVNGGRPYGYHYLDPDGSVTGSSSGSSHTIEQCLEMAIMSIKEHQEARKKAARSPSQKEKDRFKANVAFFRKNADPKNAEDLARAEQMASENGWTVDWVPDNDEYQLGDAEEAPPNEVYVAILKDAQGNVLDSLGGIGDPTREYCRVVEAEMASERLASRQ